MSSQRRFREQQRAVECHLESPAVARAERCDVDSRRPRVEELSHQTGGSIRVVSDDAELDFELVPRVAEVAHDESLQVRAAGS
jgi:hypothetical protein